MCFLASNAYLPAKAYHPFCEEGKKWKVALVHFINSAKDYQMIDCTTYEMKGDTLIDGRTCKKFYEEAYIGAFYEEGKQVYYYFNLLFYDLWVPKYARYTSISAPFHPRGYVSKYFNKITIQNSGFLLFKKSILLSNASSLCFTIFMGSLASGNCSIIFSNDLC